jgi:hypothetical protein
MVVVYRLFILIIVADILQQDRASDESTRLHTTHTTHARPTSSSSNTNKYVSSQYVCSHTSMAITQAYRPYPVVIICESQPLWYSDWKPCFICTHFDQPFGIRVFVNSILQVPRGTVDARRPTLISKIIRKSKFYIVITVWSACNEMTTSWGTSSSNWRPFDGSADGTCTLQLWSAYRLRYYHHTQSYLHCIVSFECLLKFSLLYVSSSIHDSDTRLPKRPWQFVLLLSLLSHIHSI